MLEKNEFRCYKVKIEVGGHPAVVGPWQSSGGSNQRCLGFDSWRLCCVYQNYNTSVYVSLSQQNHEMLNALYFNI